MPGPSKDLISILRPILRSPHIKSNKLQVMAKTSILKTSVETWIDLEGFPEVLSLIGDWQSVRPPKR